MLVMVRIRAPFTFNGPVNAEFADGVEFSLDCAICRKKRRTVVISPVERFSYCTATQHIFPARVVHRTIITADGITEVVYLVEYYYMPFEDAREKWSSDPASHAMPPWGRVHVALTCPMCGKMGRHSTQTNIVRPRTAHCDCGHAHFTETREVPLFEQVDMLPPGWRLIDES